MGMKDRYEGKTIRIFAPFSARILGYLQVIEVIGDNTLYGVIPNTDLYTAYSLSDGIRVEICEPIEEEQK